MKLTNINQIDNFLASVNKCKGSVWLESPDGDRIDLKSRFSQYVAIGALLSIDGKRLELFCSDPNEDAYFYEFFKNNPEVI